MSDPVRMPDGGLRITSTVGPPPSQGGAPRQGFERLLLPGIEVGLAGWERAHSQGAITGNENAKGIVYAPAEVNQRLQKLGIEQFIADTRLEKRANVELEMTTVTYTWPGTRRLKEIQYVVKAVENGSKTTLYEASITVSNDKVNPKVNVEVEARGYADLERFLRPAVKRTPARASRQKRNAGVSAVRQSKAAAAGKNPAPAGTNGQAKATGYKAPSRTQAVVGVPNNRPVQGGGPSARGTAIVGAIDLLLQGLHFALELIGDHVAKSEADAAWQKARPGIDQHLFAHPTDGALVVTRFKGYRLQGIDVEYAVSEGTARQKYARTPRIEDVDNRGYTWIPPMQDVPWRDLPTPFPKFALAKFKLGSEALIRVGFTGDPDAPFDDVGRHNKLANPDRVEVLFIVLTPPATMGWPSGYGTWVNAKVPLLTANTASGETITAVDLDSGFWDIGEAVGVPVFPVNEAAKATFANYWTQGSTWLRNQFTDIDRIAWAWPGDIEIVERA